MSPEDILCLYCNTSSLYPAQTLDHLPNHQTLEGQQLQFQRRGRKLHLPEPLLLPLPAVVVQETRMQKLMMLWKVSDCCIVFQWTFILLPRVGVAYRIAGNFRGVKLSLTSWSKKKTQNFYPRNVCACAGIVCRSRQPRIFYPQKSDCCKQRIFCPAKISRYTVAR